MAVSNLLKSFASYLRSQRVPALVSAQIHLMRTSNLPVMRYFRERSDAELSATGHASVVRFLQDLETDQIYARAEEGLRKWQADEMDGIPKRGVEPTDLVHLYSAQKQMLMAHIPDFTSDSRQAMDIALELEALFAHVQDMAFQYLTELREEAARLSAEQVVSNAYGEAVPMTVWTCSPDGHVDYVNQQWIDYSGLTLEETLGWGWWEALHPEEKASIVAAWHRSVETETPFEAIYRLRRADGSYRWHLTRAVPVRDDAGAIVKWVGTCTDIDAQRHAAAALKQSETRLAEAQRIAHLGSWEWDVPSGLIGWSDESYRIFGMDRGGPPVTYETFLSLIHPEDRAYVEQEIEMAMAGHKRFDVEHRIVRPDGTVRTVIEKAEATRDESGQMIRVIGTVHDVTDARKVEKERQELEALKQMDTLKDQFLSILSHELRTPINAITGFGSILADGVTGPLTERQQEYLAKILRGADSLLTLVNDLLDMSRIAAGKFTLEVQPVSAPLLIEEAVRTLQPLADQKGHVLVNETTEDLPPVMADAQRISQVLLNLINNAIKFTEPGGTIRVRAGSEGTHVRCEVIDTGIGVSAENLGKLFKRFTQVDGSYTRKVGGVGLGLSICKELIRAQGGDIGVESVEGVGSTFWFTLPTVAEAPSAPEVAER